MFDTRYECLTRKQANTIYAAIKEGIITADKKFISAMYNAVGSTSDSTFRIMCDCQKIIYWMKEGRLDYAQHIVNGGMVSFEQVGTNVRPSSEEEDGWFYEPNMMVEEPVWDYVLR